MKVAADRSREAATITSVQRRAFVLGSTALLASGAGRTAHGATPASPLLEAIDLELEGDRKLARRALVLVPRAQRRHRAVLILLHGLGETGNELLGIHAWGERYGLVRAYERLMSPPVKRENSKLPYLSDERARELNASLARTPFAGLVLVCPVTPNPYGRDAATVFDGYGAWIERSLLPNVRRRLGLGDAPLAIGLDGCSLGGYVGLEILLGRPALFASFGVVQPAIGRASASRYAERLAAAIARAQPLPIHIETSSRDPYREPSKVLSERLSALGVPNQFRASDGPHDQPWLREVGTLEMLLWHDRQLNHTAR